MLHEGIHLEPAIGQVSMTHSVTLDAILGKSSTQNMDWMDHLSKIPWGSIKENYPERFNHASKVFSLANMDYQVCNGGISQYFFNRYHETRDPYHKDDVCQVDLDAQKEFFGDVLKFSLAVYPNRSIKNESLSSACAAFGHLIFEEDAEVSETIYCDEDEQIWDDDLEEYVDNPDYFEPYEEFYQEDVIHNEDGFDDIFYEVNDYLEELLELQSQLCCKQLVQECERRNDSWSLAALKEVLPESAFVNAIVEHIKYQMDLKQNTTSFGEPQAWVSLKNGRSLEVILEQEGLKEQEQFYSIRLHSTESKLDANSSEEKVDIIETFTSSDKSSDELAELVSSALSFNEVCPIERDGVSQDVSVEKPSLTDQIQAASDRADSSGAENEKSSYLENGR